LERDLHDGAQQSLLGVGIVLNLARHEAEDGSAAALLMDEARDRLRDALADLRRLARGLAPAMLAERGLAEALNDLARRCPVAVDLRVDVAERPPSPIELAAYFVVAEALQNVARHAAARRAEVTVTLDDAELHVEVSDDGKGGTNPAAGSGLRGLTDRVAAIGGTLTLRSPPGAGTTVHARLPRQPEIDVTG
jgi:signal transduction histidine kinase